ncbi:hypothetical protein E2542_SST09127 [Spatholobus suberectus]|nr:hypothetical protein E2542_SST09127 [Spatholobus suberectus]
MPLPSRHPGVSQPLHICRRAKTALLCCYQRAANTQISFATLPLCRQYASDASPSHFYYTSDRCRLPSWPCIPRSGITRAVSRRARKTLSPG